ncbi:four helix bundle protein [Pedobacter rhodius]|uniref:Four helix bundle protein n=1 Tax=Pedobacter rhodius TaxID=3004098 RepID=A0ABT4L357_9SPHI|nr:four helix bundle protein [Pedobacter sp. SJ11]MCZ4225622.1 four helix bundle protein [Pedobacter sp. SJ11]
MEPIRSDFGLKDQFRKTAMSMSDNIAEGFEYNNNPDFIRFLTYAKSSSGEFRNKIINLEEAKKISSNDFKFLYEKCIEFSSKTKHLIDYLRNFEKKKKTLKKVFRTLSV